MKGLAQAIEADSILLDLDADSVEDIWSQMLGRLVEEGEIDDDSKGAALEALARREEEASTAIGNAVAVPHTYLDSVPRPRILFARLAHPMQLGAPDGVATRYVFLLVGPPGRAAEHLDALAAIARLMSEDEFRYAARHGESVEELLTALHEYAARTRAPRPEEATAVDDALAYTGRFGGGIAADVRRRLVSYKQDFTDGFHSKVVGATAFLFFACLAPAITFGGVMADQTGGSIGAVEMLAASAICGIIYSLFSGSPMIILGGTGPMLVITAILYGLCNSWGIPFLPVYAAVGLWSAVLLILLAFFDASALMRHFTRFTDEIFAGLISIIFIVEALKAVFGFLALENGQSHEGAFLSVILALGCFYVAMSLFRFRRSRYLAGWTREFLADFGPTIALASMTVVALSFSSVSVPALHGPDEFAPTMDRSWLVDLSAAPAWIWGAAIVPALLVAILVYLDQNITARVVNSPDNKLLRGTAYHLDLALVGGLVAVCSVLGLPWLVAATVRSLNHVRALATVEEQRTVSGAAQDRIIHTRETRVTGLAIHVLIGLSLLALPVIKMIPTPVLYGLFLYMGVVSLRGNQLFERVMLWPTDRRLYPSTHYLKHVPTGVVHRYTAVQVACLAVLWIVKMSAIAILFPICIALLVPIRFMLNRYMAPGHLEALDSDETPKEETTRSGGV